MRHMHGNMHRMPSLGGAAENGMRQRKKLAGDLVFRTRVSSWCSSVASGVSPGMRLNWRTMTMAPLWLQLKLAQCHMLRLLLTVCVPPMACIMPCAVLWLALLLKGAAALSPDGLALLDFKTNLINGDVALFDWLESDATPCSWLGVTCASDAFSVTQLWVSSSSLEGKLSSSLGSLPNLTVLNLYGNKLSGSIPPEIANARSLDQLGLSNNRLSGSIPSGISNLRNLTWLDLSGNSLSGSIPPLDDLTDLQYLVLDRNSLSGPIPDLSLLTGLLEVYLGGGNNLSASAGKAPDLANLRDLQTLDLSGCNIQGAMPTWLAGMPNLTLLNLSFNQLGGPIGEQIWANKSLVMVDLSSNQFNGTIPGQLLQQLQLSAGFGNVLNLSSNGLTGRIPDTLTANAGQGLFTVDLSNNRLEWPIPSSFGRLGALRLQNNRLEGEIGSALSCFNSSRLFDLRLQDNNFTGELGPSTFAHWQRLKFLDLSRNAGLHLVDGTLRLMLDTFPNLEEVRLNGIGGSGKLLPTKNTTIPSLKVLDLGRSGLEGDLSDFLQADAGVVPFPGLELLDLSENRLTGNIPSSLLCMLSLTALNLSFNQFSGQLPLLPPRFFSESFFAGNPQLCGKPMKLRCTPCRYQVVLKLLAALVACSLVISACSCFFLIWRLRIYSKRHQQDADLIAALKGKDTACLMPLADLRKATSNFADSSQIGEGGFGTVYKGKLPDGTLVAIKKSKRLGSQQDKDQFLNEVRILSQVNHRNLVQLLGCCLANGVALLVFEYVPNGSLEDHLWRRSPAATAPPLTWTQRLRIALHTAEALAYLHSAANPPIFHRDVKSANILLDENMNAKVADFGISKLAPLDATHVSTMAVQGTRGYIDPEYYMTCKLSAKSDVFSFGVVLLELISGRAPVYLERAASENEATPASLARVAVPLINSNSMQEIIDPALSETFWSATGGESMLAVGALAVRCLKPKSKDRPRMTQVCNELQSLWLSLDTTFNFSDQVLPGSHLLGLQDIPENDCISFPSNSSCPQGSMSPQVFTCSSSHDVQLAYRATF